MADELNLEDLTSAEKDAAALSDAAVRLDQARGNPNSLAAALEHNLELWVGIRTMVSRWSKEHPMPMPTRENLVKLSHYVADTTFKHANNMTDQVLDSLIKINLEISEGLLEGNKKPR